MSKRLQVIVADDEMKEIRQAAARDRLAVGEWVRRRLRDARGPQLTISPEDKIRAIREAVKLKLSPSPGIEQMNREIEQGYLEGWKS